MRKVKIDRLNIRIKGVSRQVYRQSMDGLGREVLSHLLTSGALSKANGNISLRQADCGTLQVSRDATPSGTRTMIARAVARSISSSIS